MTTIGFNMYQRLFQPFHDTTVPKVALTCGKCEQESELGSKLRVTVNFEEIYQVAQYDLYDCDPATEFQACINPVDIHYQYLEGHNIQIAPDQTVEFMDRGTLLDYVTAYHRIRRHLEALPEYQGLSLVDKHTGIADEILTQYWVAYLVYETYVNTKTLLPVKPFLANYKGFIRADQVEATTGYHLKSLYPHHTPVTADDMEVYDLPDGSRLVKYDYSGYFWFTNPQQ